MGISQSKSRRSPTGARHIDYRKKKQHEQGRMPVLTKIGELFRKSIRTIGGNRKSKLLAEQTINAFDPKSKKAVKAKMTTVVENKANRNFIRRNILTKGTVVDTDKGKVKITNRPGQEGTLNGIIVE